jgi:hypothetical protein
VLLDVTLQFGDFLSGKMLRKESSDPFERVRQQAEAKL